MRRDRRAHFLVAGLVCAALSGCAAPTGPADGAEPTAVVLISIDTLRADRLPAYGYAEVETPEIDRLAADAILFENAFSHAPTTLPSHASLLTGTLPTRHGARDNAGFEMDPTLPTLAGLLHTAGYRTGGFVSSYPLRADTGIGAGFDVYDADLDVVSGAGIGEIQRDGETTIRKAVEWLQRADERPPFLFVHLFEPHLPYEAPDDLAARYPSPYDAEVALVDRLVGELLAALRDLDLYDDALVLFVADHGEGLGEHGEDHHGMFVYATTLHVPLIVKLPRAERSGERVAAPAQLIDVLPSVLAAVGVETPVGLAGRPLQSIDASTPTPSIYAETYFPRLRFGWSELTSLIEFPYHYIEAPEPELYDLEDDPGELLNRVFEQADPSRRLGARLATLVEPPTDGLAVSPEVRDRLAALGYLGGGFTSETLADPKSKTHVLRHLKAAAELFFAGRYEEAIEEYESTLKEDPGILSAWEFLARAQLQAGHAIAATETLEVLIGMGPHDATPRLTLGEIYLRLERPADAARAARPAVAARPAAANFLLARVALAEDRPDDAIARLREVVAANPDHGGAHAMLARLGLDRGLPPSETLHHVDLALANAPEPAATGGLRVVRGRALLALDRPEEAADSFINEMELFPGNLAAYRQLALLHLTRGRAEIGIEVLRRMTAANAGPDAELRAIDTLREAGHGPVAEQWRTRAAERYPSEPSFRGPASLRAVPLGPRGDDSDGDATL